MTYSMDRFSQSSSKYWSRRSATANGTGKAGGFGDFSGDSHTHCSVCLSRLADGVIARCGCIEKSEADPMEYKPSTGG